MIKTSVMKELTNLSKFNVVAFAYVETDLGLLQDPRWSSLIWRYGSKMEPLVLLSINCIRNCDYEKIHDSIPKTFA